MFRCPEHGVQRAYLACRHTDELGVHHVDKLGSPRQLPRALCKPCFDVGPELDPEALDPTCAVCVGLMKMLGAKGRT